MFFIFGSNVHTTMPFFLLIITFSVLNSHFFKWRLEACKYDNKYSSFIFYCLMTSNFVKVGDTWKSTFFLITNERFLDAFTQLFFLRRFGLKFFFLLTLYPLSLFKRAGCSKKMKLYYVVWLLRTIEILG